MRIGPLALPNRFWSWLAFAAVSLLIMFDIGSVESAQTKQAPTQPANSQERSETVHDPAYAAFDEGNFVAALEEASKAAERGEPAAHTLIGRIHEEGLGVAKDDTKAAQWYHKAARLGDVNAQFALAVMLAKGRGVERDYGAAANLFELASRSGHADAHYNLALLYVNGTGRPTDMVKAAEHLQAAAAQDHAAAQYDLGGLYEMGHGVEHDDGLAAHWIRRAAYKGLAAAQLEFAIMLYKGRGIIQDRKKAVWFLTAAAEKGNAVAQNRLARLYAYGEIVEANIIIATKWHLLARDRGVSDFKLDQYISRLTKNELEAARLEASAWRDREVTQR